MTQQASHAFTITFGDISLLQLRDGAIVNPSNTGLILGSGVSELIARRAGPFFQQQLHTIRTGLPGNRLEPGQVVVTDSGQLPSKNIIHISLIGKKKVDRKLITNALLTIYDTADSIEVSELAFPALGVGVAKFPIEDFISLFWKITLEELPRCESVRHVVLCLYNEQEFEVVRNYVEKHKSEVPESVQLEVKAATSWSGF